MVNETAFNCTNVQRAITSSEEVEKSVYRSNCSLKKAVSLYRSFFLYLYTLYKRKCKKVLKMPTATIQYVCVATNPINYNCLTSHSQAVVVYVKGSVVFTSSLRSPHARLCPPARSTMASRQCRLGSTSSRYRRCLRTCGRRYC